ncbi:MAG: hypothetical protein ACP5I1_13435 [Candidatus Hinthialibacter sp.]
MMSPLLPAEIERWSYGIMAGLFQATAHFDMQIELTWKSDYAIRIER